MSTSNIKVVVRVRPFIELERSIGHPATTQQQQQLQRQTKTLKRIVNVLDENVLIIDPGSDYMLDDTTGESIGNRGKASGTGSSGNTGPGQRTYGHKERRTKEMRYAFDRVFNERATQEEVFGHTAKPLIDGVLDGFNSTVFAYGATGCGKTHTITGTKEDPGVIFLCMQELFNRIEEIRQEQGNLVEISAHMSYFEVYNETIRDLLVPQGVEAEAQTPGGTPRTVDISKATSFAQGPPLDLREDDSNNRVIVAGLTEHKPQRVSEVMKLLIHGNDNRTKAPTMANAVSSRSHAILQIHIKKTSKGGVNNPGTFNDVSNSVLSIIDLAGSERASATQNRGSRLLEGANINRSLLALGNCITLLCNKGENSNVHIPYRDSKLTRLLKYSLGGNCKVVMIANISPSSVHYDETHNTLKYANRAKNIKTKVEKNDISVAQHISVYPQIIDRLKAELQKIRFDLDYTQAELDCAMGQLDQANKRIIEQDVLLLSSANEMNESNNSNPLGGSNIISANSKVTESDDKLIKEVLSKAEIQDSHMDHTRRKKRTLESKLFVYRKMLELVVNSGQGLDEVIENLNNENLMMARQHYDTTVDYIVNQIRDLESQIGLYKVELESNDRTIRGLVDDIEFNSAERVRAHRRRSSLTNADFKSSYLSRLINYELELYILRRDTKAELESKKFFDNETDDFLFDVLTHSISLPDMITAIQQRISFDDPTILSQLPPTGITELKDISNSSSTTTLNSPTYSPTGSSKSSGSDQMQNVTGTNTNIDKPTTVASVKNPRSLRCGTKHQPLAAVSRANSTLVPEAKPTMAVNSRTPSKRKASDMESIDEGVLEFETHGVQIRESQEKEDEEEEDDDDDDDEEEVFDDASSVMTINEPETNKFKEMSTFTQQSIGKKEVFDIGTPEFSDIGIKDCNDEEDDVDDDAKMMTLAVDDEQIVETYKQRRTATNQTPKRSKVVHVDTDLDEEVRLQRQRQLDAATPRSRSRIRDAMGTALSVAKALLTPSRILSPSKVNGNISSAEKFKDVGRLLNFNGNKGEDGCAITPNLKKAGRRGDDGNAFVNVHAQMGSDTILQTKLENLSLDTINKNDINKTSTPGESRAEFESMDPILQYTAKTEHMNGGDVSPLSAKSTGSERAKRRSLQFGVEIDMDDEDGQDEGENETMFEDATDEDESTTTTTQKSQSKTSKEFTLHRKKDNSSTSKSQRVKPQGKTTAGVTESTTLHVDVSPTKLRHANTRPLVTTPLKKVINFLDESSEESSDDEEPVKEKPQLNVSNVGSPGDRAGKKGRPRRRLSLLPLPSGGGNTVSSTHSDDLATNENEGFENVEPVNKAEVADVKRKVASPRVTRATAARRRAR